MGEKSLPGIGVWIAGTLLDGSGNSPRQTSEGHHGTSGQAAYSLWGHPILIPLAGENLVDRGTTK